MQIEKDPSGTVTTSPVLSVRYGELEIPEHMDDDQAMTPDGPGQEAGGRDAEDGAGGPAEPAPEDRRPEVKQSDAKRRKCDSGPEGEEGEGDRDSAASPAHVDGMEEAKDAGVGVFVCADARTHLSPHPPEVLPQARPPAAIQTAGVDIIVTTLPRWGGGGC